MHRAIRSARLHIGRQLLDAAGLRETAARRDEQLTRLVQRRRRTGWFPAAGRVGAVHGGSQQAARIGMNRRAHDLAERALLDDLPAYITAPVADFDRDADIVVTKMTDMPNSRCSSRSSSRI